MQFLVVDRWRNHLANLLSRWTSSKISNLALEFRRYLPKFHRHNYFRFWRSYRYDRLLVASVLTCQKYFPLIRGIILQICRWNFNCTFHSFRDTRFPVSAVVTDCRSLLESPRRYSSCKFATVEFRRFIVGMFDGICHSFEDITTSV